MNGLSLSQNQQSGRWNKGQEQLTVCNELEIEGGGLFYLIWLCYERNGINHRLWNKSERDEWYVCFFL